jgi:hypothetical protein
MTSQLPANIRVWVEALRSGEYRQCKGSLHKGKGFCCLGVYAVVSGISNPEDMLACRRGDEGPFEVYEAIRDQLYSYVVENGIEMNDSGKTFSEIADMIEREYSNG